MKDKFKLSKEEQEIEDEAHLYQSVTGPELKEIEAAIRARQKNKTITLRINEHDLAAIKKRAKKQGVKYQTYITEILHYLAWKK